MAYEIMSGNIAEGVVYQVTGTGGIVYNSITVNSGSYFTGVVGVDTYTVDTPTPLVIEASLFTGVSLGGKLDTFLGKFPDESYFEGVSLGLAPAYYPEKYTTEEIIQNDKNFIDAENLIYLKYHSTEIENIIGDELYTGVTYKRLIELANQHPEISLEIETPNNIKSITFNITNLPPIKILIHLLLNGSY